MEITKEYYKENIQVVNDMYKHGVFPMDAVRYEHFVKFCTGAKTILSVGCGGREPIAITATHACDIVPNSGEYLKKDGWNGEFKIASCTDLPYPDNSMDVVVCSEVIEHIPLLSDVERTFKEVNRVGKKWIMTTPHPPIWFPTHKRIFTCEQLIELTKDYNVDIFEKDIFFFIQT
jgi:2-polyprenyl-3-methyl-5-hydroxy-6-metoxy-1,4-benzoquinol methylase